MKRPTIVLAGALAAGLLAAGCTADGTRPAVGVRPTPAYGPLGLERVVGQDAAGLARLFGEPAADFREGNARKLQFAGPICVLDAYLYPRGSEPARVTYLDARQPDGRPIDRASCVASLAQARR